MAPAVDEVSIDDKTSQPNKRRRFYKGRRKNPSPRVLSSYLSTNSQGQSSEAKANKNKGKEVNLNEPALNTDSEVKQMKKNTSCEEKQELLASKEPVPENLSVSTKDQINECKDKDREVENAKNSESSSGFGLGQCVRILRELECSGYVDSIFRQKFLTWFGLRATTQEKNVVKTFSYAFKDDAIALAEQLVHTFSDCIEPKSSVIGDGNRGGSSGTSCKKARH